MPAPDNQTPPTNTTQPTVGRIELSAYTKMDARPAPPVPAVEYRILRQQLANVLESQKELAARLDKFERLLGVIQSLADKIDAAK